MLEGIVSYASLAKRLKPDVERELGRVVKGHAIVMALKRYAEDLKKVYKRIKFDRRADITLKTHLCEVTVLKTPSIISKLGRLYDLVNLEDRFLPSVIEGENEISILVKDKYRDRLLKILEGEKVLNVEKNLISLTISCPKDYKYTPGVVLNVARSLAWENINIYKITSTDTELTVLLNERDAVRGYRALERLLSGENQLG